MKLNSKELREIREKRMPAEIEDLDTPEESSSEEREEEPGEEFVTEKELAEKYRRSPAWLKKKVSIGSILRRRKGKQYVYRESDVAEQVEFEQKDQTIVQALTAATNLAEQAQKNMQAMFELHHKANVDILEAMMKSLDGSRKYVGDLEAQNKEMRELSEHQKTEEHLRKLAEVEQEKSQATREKAMAMVQQVALPLVMKKLGIEMPKTPATGDPNPAMQALASVATDLLKSLTPEQMEKLKDILSEEQVQVIEVAKQVIGG